MEDAGLQKTPCKENTSSNHCCCKEIQGNFQQIRNDIQGIKFEIENKMAAIVEMISNLKTGQVGSDMRSLNNLLPAFPLQTPEDFTSFNRNLIDNADMRSQFEKLILKTGVRTIDKTMRNFLNNVLSNEIGEIYTWTGIRKGSLKMNGTAFASVIVSVYSNHLNTTVQIIENAIAVWLRRTSDRLNNISKHKSRPINGEDLN